MKSQNLLIILISAILVAGCSLINEKTPPVSAGVVLPTLPNYSESFRFKFANEVDFICGHEQKEIDSQFPYSCTFIKDALELRSSIKALQK